MKKKLALKKLRTLEFKRNKKVRLQGGEDRIKGNFFTGNI